MSALPAALAAWRTPAFQQVLQQELESWPVSALPLQRALLRSSYVSPSTPHSVRVIACHEDAQHILVKIGIFYAGIIAGCNCADDPTPPNEEPEYCELALAIDKHSAVTQLSLLESE